MGISALRKRLQDEYGLQLSSVTDDQLDRVVQQAGPGAPLSRIADHLPISESSLLRDPDVWEWLARELEARLPARALRGEPLRILSLGCSEGQEAYTLAITALEAARGAGLPAALGRRLVQVDGVDISAARIDRARSGELAAWSVRGAPPERFRAHLTPTAAGWKVSAAARELCQFQVGNLLTQGQEQLAGYDLVFCRHVLIYFAPPHAREVLAGLAAKLSPGATLVVAPVEAHLLEGIANLSQVGLVGAVMKAPQSAPKAELPTSPTPPSGAPVAAALSAEDHRARAVLAFEQGRLHEAISLARAATFMEPEHLGGRLLLGRLQLRLEPEVGRRMITALLGELRGRRHSADPDLSLHQLEMAAHRLLGNG